MDDRPIVAYRYVWKSGGVSPWYDGVPNNTHRTTLAYFEGQRIELAYGEAPTCATCDGDGYTMGLADNRAASKIVPCPDCTPPPGPRDCGEGEGEKNG